MKDSSLRGIYPAIVTPLTDDRRISTQSAARLMQRLLAAGVDGVYAAGSTGEGMRLQLEDRKALVDCLAGNLVDGKKLLVHVGAQRVEDAIHLAKHAAAAGAHAVSSLPPRGTSAQIRDYYQRLAESSPLPLILYYFPQACPWAFREPGELRELSALENVAAVKFTDYNLFLLQQMASNGVLLYNGHDEVLAAGLLLGAGGGIGSTYNLAPELYVEMYQSALAHHWERARAIQKLLNAMIAVLLNYPFLPALKAALGSSGIECGPALNGESFHSESQRRQFLLEFDAVLSELSLESR